MRSLSAIRPVLGIAALSALGSVPMHLATLWVEALAVEHELGIFAANATLSTFLFGQILGIIALSFTKLEPTGPALLGATLIFAILLAAAALTPGNAIFPAIWWAIGAFSGALMFAGFRAAALSGDTRFVFSLRLSIVLALSGAIALIVAALPTGSYTTTLTLTSAVTLVVAGLSARNALGFSAPPQPEHAQTQSSTLAASAIPLAMAFVLFVGQIGFLANAGFYISAATGLAEATAISVGIGKLAVGGLLIAVFIAVRSWPFWAFLSVSFALGATTLVLASPATLLIASLSFLCFELFLNITSSILLGDISDRLAGFWQRALLWITICGSLTGPLIAGAALNAGNTWLPIAIALGSTCTGVIYSFSFRRETA